LPGCALLGLYHGVACSGQGLYHGVAASHGLDHGVARSGHGIASSNSARASVWTHHALPGGQPLHKRPNCAALPLSVPPPTIDAACCPFPPFPVLTRACLSLPSLLGYTSIWLKSVPINPLGAHAQLTNSPPLPLSVVPPFPVLARTNKLPRNRVMLDRLRCLTDRRTAEYCLTDFPKRHGFSPPQMLGIQEALPATVATCCCCSSACCSWLPGSARNCCCITSCCCCSSCSADTIPCCLCHSS